MSCSRCTRGSTRPGRRGTPLLFETYQLASSIADRRRELDLHVPADPGGDVAGARAVDGAHRVDPGAAGASEPAGARAADAARARRVRTRAAPDRRRPPRRSGAGDRRSGDAAVRRSRTRGRRRTRGITLRSSASAVRGSVRTLRSAIVGIYPPNLQQAGLAGCALGSGGAGSTGTASRLTLEVDADAGFGADVDAAAVPRCQEALRNVEEHADARHVRLRSCGASGRAVLEVADDGRGIAPDALAERRRRRAHGPGDPRATWWATPAAR